MLSRSMFLAISAIGCGMRFPIVELSTAMILVRRTEVVHAQSNHALPFLLLKVWFSVILASQTGLHVSETKNQALRCGPLTGHDCLRTRPTNHTSIRNIIREQ